MNYQALNDAYNTFNNIFLTVWSPILQIYGIKILFACATLAIGILGLEAIRSGNISSVVEDISRTLVGIGVVYLIFLHSTDWGQAVLDTFRQIGGATTGLSPNALTPSGIMQAGYELAKIFWVAGASASWFTTPMVSFKIALFAMTMLIAYAIAAVIYLEVLLEAGATLIAGSILIALAPFQWTWPLLERWAFRILGLVIRIMMILMICAVGLALSVQWTSQMVANSASIVTNAWIAAEGALDALIFMILVVTVPLKFASLASSGLSATIGEGLLTAAGGAAAGAAISAGSSGAGSVIAAGHSVGSGSGGGSSSGGQDGSSSGAQAASQNVQAMLMQTGAGGGTP